jgi:hypothetical protein
MLTIFTATANATTLQDVIDERSARDVLDLAAHRRQRSERNRTRDAVSESGAACERPIGENRGLPRKE